MEIPSESLDFDHWLLQFWISLVLLRLFSPRSFLLVAWPQWYFMTQEYLYHETQASGLKRALSQNTLVAVPLFILLAAQFFRFHLAEVKLLLVCFSGAHSLLYMLHPADLFRRAFSKLHPFSSSHLCHSFRNNHWTLFVYSYPLTFKVFHTEVNWDLFLECSGSLPVSLFKPQLKFICTAAQSHWKLKFSSEMLTPPSSLQRLAAFCHAAISPVL